MSNSHDRLPIASLADLLAAVPYLLGFHPTDSLVVIGLTGKRVTVAGRTDLPRRADLPTWLDGISRQQLAMLRNVAATTAIMVGYGPAADVTPVVDTLTPRLHTAGVTILDALRVTDNRYYSYQCHDPHCCPAEGVAFDPVHSAVAVHAVVAGQAALPDRAALVASVAPTTGAARTAMATATRRAQERHFTALSAGGRAAVIRAGRKAVRETFARYADDRVLTDDEAAWLSVLLTDDAVRDIAWQATDTAPWHLALWTDLTRRAEPALAAAPATLLAFTAWRQGLGALASVALDRALDADPHYSLAQLIDRALRDGIPPTVLDSWPATGNHTP